jgi:hypothetical protein
MARNVAGLQIMLRPYSRSGEFVKSSGELVRPPVTRSPLTVLRFLRIFAGF